MDVNLYCYGSGEQIQGILNGVASIIKPSTTYFQYISIAFVLAFFIGAIHYIQTRKVSALVYTALRYTVITTVLLSPIYKVNIIDEINQGKVYSVNSVPLGLAIPASLSSTFFHGLTKLVETAFHMPDDLNYTQSGFLFASNLMHKAPSIQAINAQDRENLKSYVEQCVFYDIHHGKYSKSELLNSDNIWGLVSAKPSPIRSFVLDSKIVTCKDGTPTLTERLKEIEEETGIKYAKAIFPGLKFKEDALLKQSLITYIGNSYTHLTGISKEGSEIMQQMIVMNAIKDGAMNNSALAGLSYTKSKGDMQKFLGSVSTGVLAAQWLPILKDVIECLLYAVFVLIVIYALFTDSYKLFINYIVSLAYIGSWPVVYAFLNYGASFAIRTTSNGYTLSMTDLPHLDATNYYMSAIFGYVSLTVPYLSWQLINMGKQGLGAALTQLSQLIGGSTQSIAMGTAGEMATGNLSFGNASIGNHNTSNMSGYKHDTNLSFASGMISATTPSGSVVSQHLDGHSTINQTPALSNLNARVSLSESIQTSASQQADFSTSAAYSDAASYINNMASTIQETINYGQHMSRGESSGENYGLTNSSGTSESYQHLEQLVDRFCETYGYSKSEGVKYLAGAYANASGNLGWSSDKMALAKAFTKLTGVSGGVSGNSGKKLEIDESESHTMNEGLSNAKEFVQNNNFSDTLEQSIRGFQENSYRDNSDEGQRISNDVMSSYQKANQASESANANWQSAKSYRDLATVSQNEAASIDFNASQNFKDWLSQQSMHPGLGAMGDTQADYLLRNNPKLCQQYLKNYVQQETAQRINAWREEHVNPASVSAADEEHRSIVGNHNVQGAFKEHQANIQNAANVNGLGKGVVDLSAKSAALEHLKNNSDEMSSLKKSTKIPNGTGE